MVQIANRHDQGKGITPEEKWMDQMNGHAWNSITGETSSDIDDNLRTSGSKVIGHFDPTTGQGEYVYYATNAQRQH